MKTAAGYVLEMADSYRERKPKSDQRITGSGPQQGSLPILDTVATGSVSSRDASNDTSSDVIVQTGHQERSDQRESLASDILEKKTSKVIPSSSVSNQNSDAGSPSLLSERNEKESREEPLFISIATNYTSRGIKMDASPFEECTELEPWMHCSYQPFEQYNTSHALLFRGFHLVEKDILPPYHPPHQKWIYAESESPFRTWSPYRLSLDIWDQFNVTMTYMEDSDLKFSIFDFRCKPKPDYKAPVPPINYAANKTGNASVLWMVSNCHGTTGREAYVEELQKYMDVDIYGACGKLGNGPCGAWGEFKLGCLYEFMAQYKFYLAFENSFCEDYITEKITKTTDVNVITVVMGNVDFELRMTKGTYLDVRDYKSPKELADHLKYLDGNDTAYNEIIERKMKLTCPRTSPRNTFHCDLCQYLHLHRNEKQIAPNIKKFFGLKERCQSPRQFFNGTADIILPNIKNLDFV